jgi:hypothetical protein
LADARVQLRAVTGAAAPVATTAQLNPSFDAQAVAGGVRDKLTSLDGALHDPNPAPDEIARRRNALNAEAVRAEAALDGVNDPRADQLRSALTAAREAAAGDNGKVQNALSGFDSALKGR